MVWMGRDTTQVSVALAQLTGQVVCMQRDVNGQGYYKYIDSSPPLYRCRMSIIWLIILNSVSSYKTSELWSGMYSSMAWTGACICCYCLHMWLKPLGKIIIESNELHVICVKSEIQKLRQVLRKTINIQKIMWKRECLTSSQFKYTGRCQVTCNGEKAVLVGKKENTHSFNSKDPFWHSPSAWQFIVRTITIFQRAVTWRAAHQSIIQFKHHQSQAWGTDITSCSWWVPIPTIDWGANSR